MPRGSSFARRKHQAFVARLRAGGETETLQQDLKRVLIDPTTAYAQVFDARRSVFWRSYAGAVADIDGWVSERAAAKAINRLQKYAEAVSRLNRQG